MVLVRADYVVENPKDLEKVKTIVREFMEQVKKNEPNTISYRSLQEKENPTRFSHLVEFTDIEAEHLHKKSSYNKEFTSRLYPLCDGAPQFIYFNEVSL